MSETVKINVGDLESLRTHLGDLPSSVRQSEVQDLLSEIASAPSVPGSVTPVSVAVIERSLGVVQSSAYIEGVDAERAKSLDRTLSALLGYTPRLRAMRQTGAPRPDAPAALQGEDAIESQAVDQSAAVREAYDGETEELSEEELAAYEAEIGG